MGKRPRLLHQNPPHAPAATSREPPPQIVLLPLDPHPTGLPHQMLFQLLIDRTLTSQPRKRALRFLTQMHLRQQHLLGPPGAFDADRAPTAPTCSPPCEPPPAPTTAPPPPAPPTQ